MSTSSDNIASNFKLFSNLDNSSKLAHSSPMKRSIETIVFVATILLVGIAYYYRNEIQQFYDSHVHGWISRLWIATHLNSKGELATTFVPEEFSLTNLPLNIFGSDSLESGH